jgi:protein SCO1/2
MKPSTAFSAVTVTSLRQRHLASGCLLAALLGAGAGTPAQAASGHENHAQMLGSQSTAMAEVIRLERQITLPDVTMTRNDKMRLSFAKTVDDGRPVLLNFIYTTCNAICPVTSQVFAEFRGLLGAEEREAINMVSVSIDPEQDTPRKLTAYAKRFGTSGTWPHFTGSTADTERVQRAFEAWRGDKMNHVPQTFIRPAPGKPWVRLDGFISPEGLLSEYRKLTGAKK